MPENSSNEAASLANIEKSFGGGPDSMVHVLKGSTLTACMGEMLLLIGPSGCGKTTLLSILCGTLKPDAGQATLFGRKLQEMKDSEITKYRGQNIGFVFQQFNLIPTLTLAENVAVPLLINGFSTRNAERMACEALARVGLGDRTRTKPGKLSGGQQQRVAIARALVMEPALVLADEPTGNLDTQSADSVFDLLREVNEASHTSFLIVTHDPRLAQRCDRIIELVDGRIASDKPNVAQRRSAAAT